ncbi:sigma-70 family RNA polymerase sigma factor [Paenibacillus sp. P26]|nr:sigma-70 family RNA polymerase sigma factor [Paenibacillus sp. P26]
MRCRRLGRRLSRSGQSDIRNLGGWLTTVVSRICLDMLRSRKFRREESFEAQVPETFADGEDRSDPEREAALADAVGLALLVVLDRLNPAERITFVLHDTFGIPFTEIAPIVGKSEAAVRQLATRARRRIQGRERPLKATSPGGGGWWTLSLPPPRRAISTH